MIPVLGLVPARGGSKGVPRKNVRDLVGKPLLAYTAEAALGAATLARIVLSTDDAEIAAVGRRCGLDVPFMRPAELSRDDTPTLPVVQHALRELERMGDRYDAVCLLQPTSPLRSASLIDECVSRFVSERPDSVISVRPVPAEFNPHWVYFLDEDGSARLSTGERTPVVRRQDLPCAYHRDGAVYVTDCEVVKAGSLYGERVLAVVSPEGPTVNIDDEEDWRAAELAIRGSSTTR